MHITFLKLFVYTQYVVKYPALRPTGANLPRTTLTPTKITITLHAETIETMEVVTEEEGVMTVRAVLIRGTTEGAEETVAEAAQVEGAAGTLLFLIY